MRRFLELLGKLFAVPIAMMTVGLVDEPAMATETVDVKLHHHSFVKLHHHSFLPGVVTVHPGDRVIFRNDDPDLHSVILIDHEDVIQETFVEPGHAFTIMVPETMKPGEYMLHCTIHRDMKARFVVERS